MALSLRSAGCTRAGSSAPNEDAYAHDDERRLFAVADGVGTYRGAALASALVVEECLAALAGEPPADVRAWLAGAARRAAEALHARGAAPRELRSMSAALTLAAWIGDAWWLLHVGDTRAYLLRDGALAQLTRDHSVAWEQLEAGAITKAQLRTHPNQRLLTRSFTASRGFVVPAIESLAARPGDRLLLCSDGVSKVLEDERLARLLAGAGAPAELATAVVEAAAREGLVDDTTAVVILT